MADGWVSHIVNSRMSFLDAQLFCEPKKQRGILVRVGVDALAKNGAKMIFFVDFERTAFFLDVRCILRLGTRRIGFLMWTSFSSKIPSAPLTITRPVRKVAVKPSVPESAAICFDAKLKVSMRRSRWKGSFKYRRVRVRANC